MRLLIVEDNRTYAGLLAIRLTRSGFDSDQAHSASLAREAMARLDYAAIILDLGLPDEDGIALLRGIRSAGDMTPVVVVTARSGLSDRVNGLREGADDYLTKPFSMDELVARLHALLRRPRHLLRTHLFAGNVVLDSEGTEWTVDGRAQPARARELILLELLMRNKGQVVARRVFEDRLFGEVRDRDTNAIEVYLHRLRRHLIEANATVRIHSIRGVGYMMSEIGAEKPVTQINACGPDHPRQA